MAATALDLRREPPGGPGRPRRWKDEPPPGPGHGDALERLERAHARMGEATFAFLAEVGRAEAKVAAWEEGCRDLAHLLSCRFGLPFARAHRVVEAARALPRLPLLSEALRRGRLSLEKFLELARFATPEREAELLAWALRVPVGEIRFRADAEARPRLSRERRAHAARRLDWWWSSEPERPGERRFRLSCELPAAEGAVVARAISRAAQAVPALPGEEGRLGAAARRADALVALARARLGSDPDPERATVVVHARWDALTRGRRGAYLEGGPPIHPETARRIACSARIEVLFEDGQGRVLARAPARRRTPAWMLRQLLHRDRGCVFPGCGTRSHLQAHHLTPVSLGGPTDLEHEGLLCAFHHVLVHELGWGLRREAGRFVWTRPDGMPHLPGPSPGPP